MFPSPPAVPRGSHEEADDDISLTHMHIHSTIVQNAATKTT